MGCGCTEEKQNEINPDKIIITSGKNKSDNNKENLENSERKNDTLIMKQPQKNKAKIKKFIEDALMS